MLFRIESSFGAPMAAYSADLGGIIKRFGRSADSSPRKFRRKFCYVKESAGFSVRPEDH
jgi:hypothetical protein